MRSEFEVAFNEITELRSLPREVVLEALQTALISAYRRDAGASAAQRVDVTIDPNTGRARIFVEKEVVESVENPNTEVTLEKARYYDPESNLGDMVMVQVEGTTKKFGRIAAQTAKQVILQKIREAERNSLFDEYVEREGDLVTGTVQSVNASMITLSLGRAEAVMPRNQQIPGERYKPYDKVRVYVAEVKRTNRGPQIVVSRSHRNMLRRLLEYEVPEIFNGQVEIKNIAREAGYRSKVAVAALQEGIDPVGACVGMRGIRIQNIVKELHDEKIDVIEWSANQEEFIAKALSPARVRGVYLEDDLVSGRTAVVVVPDDQLSLAIGREGQNARLAAKLTGWRIDIKSVTEAVHEALSKPTQPEFVEVRRQYPEMVEEIYRIMEKKTANRTVIPEEYDLLGKFADLIERRMLEKREAARQARQAEINAVKATLPQGLFQLPISALDLPDEIIAALQPLENVGEVMWRFLIDENHLHHLVADLPSDALVQVQSALDRVVLPEEEAVPVETAPVVDEPAPASETPAIEEDEVVAGAFADEQEAEVEAPAPLSVAALRKIEMPRPEAEAVYETDEDVEFVIDPKTGKKDKKKKKERQQRRQLVFDEERGKVVAKRRRKGSRVRGEWDDNEFEE
ncbi:MAG: transcription termination/antitermination protein NusA [Chloroflexi bacterium]|nr:transcription termination/antitermination protein NusA [Chloroflexota bacterium]MDL1882135.1 transcription termination/antitermination protein NusA [Anaerolineae bacterium CFX8]